MCGGGREGGWEGVHVLMCEGAYACTRVHMLGGYA